MSFNFMAVITICGDGHNKMESIDDLEKNSFTGVIEQEAILR